MAEGVPQVEQGPPPALLFVLGDDGRLGGAGGQHGVAPGFAVAGDQGGALGLEPGEEVWVGDQAVLDHLGVAGQQLALRQGRERADVGQHQPRLVKGADQVLALAGVDPGLAADRAVDLRQKGRRHLDEVQAAQGQRGGQPGQVADHAAAEGDHDAAPVDLRVQQPLGQHLEMGEILGRLARRQDDRRAVPAGGREGVRQGRQVQPGDGLVRDHDQPAPGQDRGDPCRRLGQETLADQDLVGPRPQGDGQAFDPAHASASSAGMGSFAAVARPRSAARTRSTVTSGGPSKLSTIRSAVP